MPITIAPPVDNLFIGPGSPVNVSTDFIGPIPLDWLWTMEIRRTGDESILSSGESREPLHFVQLFTNVLTSSSGILSPHWTPQVPAAAQPAQSAQLTVRLLNGSGLVQEQTSTPVQWRPEPAGVAWVQSLLPSTITGGFTATDRANLNTVHASVVSSLPLTSTVPDVAELGIDQLQSGPPVELLGVSADFLLTGRGSIDRVSGDAGIYAYGCRWLIEAAPAGLGKLEGVINLYEQRIVQFVLIKGGAGGFEYTDQVVEDHRGSGQLTWGIPFPKRLEFSILPGVTLRFRWLLFLQAP